MNKRGYTSYLIKAIMLLLALIVMAIVASLAWLLPGGAPAKASGLSVSAESTVDFDVAIGFETSQTGGYVVSPFSKKFDLTNLSVLVDDNDTEQEDDDVYSSYDVFYDFSPLDVTGDGVTLIRPKLKNKNSQIDTESQSFSYVDPNQDYISFDMLIRANKECTLYLDSGSQAYGKSETKVNGSLFTDPREVDNAASNAIYAGCDATDIERPFSADAIVGALRVAFINYPAYSDQKQTFAAGTTPDALWIPRSDVRFFHDEANRKYYLYGEINSKDDPMAEYYLKGVNDIKMNTYTHHYYKYTTVGNTVTGSYETFDDAITIHELNKNEKPICEVRERIEGDDQYFYGKVHVNIWLEGCDSESRRALRGGEFKIDFDIRSGEDEEPTESTDAVE